MPEWGVIGAYFLGVLLILRGVYLLGGRRQFEAGRRLGRMESGARAYQRGLADGMAAKADESAQLVMRGRR